MGAELFFLFLSYSFRATRARALTDCTLCLALGDPIDQFTPTECRDERSEDQRSREHHFFTISDSDATECRTKRYEYRLNTCSQVHCPDHHCGAGEGDGFPGAEMYRSSYIHPGFRHGWGWTSFQVPYAFEHSNG